MKTKYDNGERHLEEINHVSILESVDEVFDGATSLMTLNAVMYGSTVTALVAGLPICGDLDIAVSKQEYMKICQNFASSVKWLQVNGKRIPERSTDHGRAFQVSTAHPTSSRSNPYSESKHLPVSQTAAFESVNQSRVQIIESKIMTGDRLEDSLEIVRKVDFTFCGIAVDNFGRMLEVIPHAYDDCLQRVIRIQNYQPQMDLERMKFRLHKYIERGWSLTMSIDQAVSNLNKAKTKYIKAHGKKVRPHLKKPGKRIAIFGIRKDNKSAGYCIETKAIVREAIPMTGPILDVVANYAMKEHGIELNSSINKAGIVRFWGINKPMGASAAQKTVSLATAELLHRYRDAFDGAIEREKNKSHAKMYDKKPSSNYGYVSNSSTSTTASYGTAGWK